jgi:replication-associated recombination protein RarA
LKGKHTVKTANKYAPKNLGDVIYPNDGVKTRIKAYMSGQLENNILLWGPNGTGKTTVAELLPQYISGPDALVESQDFDEILSKKDLSGFIANACSVAGFSGQAKYFMVFHEFDNAKVNCNKLWTAMDKYAEQLMVIITTNNPMNVPKSIRSRCDEIAFPALTARQVLPRALQILKAEGVNLPDKQVLHYLTQIEHLGDLRKYMGKLDDIILLSKTGGTFPPAPFFILNSNKVKFSVV